VILKYPKKEIDNILFEELIRYVSIQELIKKGGNEAVVENELALLLEEVKENIEKIISNYFDKDFCYV
jgi:hypothetical protein